MAKHISPFEDNSKEIKKRYESAAAKSNAVKKAKGHEHKVTKESGLCDSCGYNTLRLPNKELRKRGANL